MLAAVFAALHHQQIDDVRAYRESVFMFPEFGALVCSRGTQPFVFIASITLLVRKQWKLAAVVGIAGFIASMIAALAVALDASTLLYAT